MAQKGSGKRRQAPAYSADAMAIRYMAGLVLIALGVLIFMAVELGLSGNIFEGLRRLCFGLCGIMAYVLPVLPVWAGVLVIWSTQRRAPVRPWLFAFLAFFGPEHGLRRGLGCRHKRYICGNRGPAEAYRRRRDRNNPRLAAVEVSRAGAWNLYRFCADCPLYPAYV